MTSTMKSFFLKQGITHPNLHCNTFTVAKTWKQPKRLWTERWIEKMWYIHTRQYYSAIKQNELMPFAKRQNGLCSSPRQTIQYQLSKSMPQSITLKKLKLNGFIKTNKIFQNTPKKMFFSLQGTGMQKQEVKKHLE